MCFFHYEKGWIGESTRKDSLEMIWIATNRSAKLGFNQQKDALLTNPLASNIHETYTRPGYVEIAIEDGP